ncbi:MAG: type II toxin-antitoxin system death-on-curing family toxin [Patescibacteria group bacterium]|jgi:death-on-curing family protein
MPRNTVVLTIEEVERLAHRLAQETMGFNEPIPDFQTRYPGKLESCLAQPFQRLDRKSLHSTPERRTATLFYLMIKNHPFQNGNKRIAMTGMLVLLYKQHKWLRVDTKELYNFAVWVASSPPKLKDEVILAIVKFIRTNQVGL